MKKIRQFSFFLILLLCAVMVHAQQDSAAKTILLSPETLIKTDSSKKTNPRRATIRSAIIPGWGQATNKKYWKIPLVYAALGITGYVFFDNIKTYNDVQYAYKVSVAKDTNNYGNVASYLKPFVPEEITSLDNYRREFRRNIDYSVLVFILFWGLNVVDATVDAHLKDFDVSPNLSMRLKPMLPVAGTRGAGTGLSMVFDIHQARGRLIPGIR
jgi:hypothetical protein